jgi:hypothetical protein
LPQEYIIEASDGLSMRSWLTAIHACMRDGPATANGESGKIWLIRKYDVFRIQLVSGSDAETKSRKKLQI